LAALQGLVYDVPRAALRIMPAGAPEVFDALLLLPQAWGRVQCHPTEVRLEVKEGTLSLGELHVPLEQVSAIECNGTAVAGVGTARDAGVLVRLEAPVTLQAGDTLALTR
jgi:hypothetical protein